MGHPNAPPGFDEDYEAVTPQRVATGGGNAAADLIGRGEQLLQIRSKNQLLVAVQRPRDEKAFETKLKAMAAQAGEDFYYSIPYKDHKPGCQDRRNCSCPVKPVEGPGVGLARAAAMYWTNCSVETRTSADNADHWLVESTFIDFENNFTKTEEKRVSKLVPLKGGRYVVARDKDLDKTYQQGASKVERDVILRALPKHIIDGAWELAKVSALMDKKPIQEVVGRVVRKFQELGVTVPMLNTLLGHAMDEAGWKQGVTAALGQEATKEQVVDYARDRLAHLRGVLTAIAGGQVTVEEVFPTPGAEPSQAPADGAPGAVTQTDLNDAKAALGDARASTGETAAAPITPPAGFVNQQGPAAASTAPRRPSW